MKGKASVGCRRALQTFCHQREQWHSHQLFMRAAACRSEVPSGLSRTLLLNFSSVRKLTAFSFSSSKKQGCLTQHAAAQPRQSSFLAVKSHVFVGFRVQTNLTLMQFLNQECDSEMRFLQALGLLCGCAHRQCLAHHPELRRKQHRHSIYISTVTEKWDSLE